MSKKDDPQDISHSPISHQFYGQAEKASDFMLRYFSPILQKTSRWVSFHYIQRKIRKNVHLNLEESDSEKKSNFIREIFSTAILAFSLMFILNTFLIRTYLIPSESMEDTLHGCQGCVNDRILIDKLSYNFLDPHPGDVIVFKAPNTNWIEPDYVSPRSRKPFVHVVQNILAAAGLQPPNEYTLIKRVIAVGGQKIQCRIADGGITVDGKLIHEPYLSSVAQQQRGVLGPCWYGDGNNFALNGEFGPINVPPHTVFVMGDNRSNSKDSRFHIGDGNFGCIPDKDIKGIARWIIYPFHRAGNISLKNPQK